MIFKILLYAAQRHESAQIIPAPRALHSAKTNSIRIQIPSKNPNLTVSAKNLR